MFKGHWPSHTAQLYLNFTLNEIHSVVSVLSKKPLYLLLSMQQNRLNKNNASYSSEDSLWQPTKNNQIFFSSASDQLCNFNSVSSLRRDKIIGVAGKVMCYCSSFL